MRLRTAPKTVTIAVLMSVGACVNTTPLPVSREY
jgi:hypothetical protein